jgi:hypothetical protein
MSEPNPELMDEENPEWSDETFENAVPFSRLPKNLQSLLGQPKQLAPDDERSQDKKPAA